ncbi:MAG: response regulator [Myxococcales bacterium]|jgi:DNA-binding NtrC family response regulator|nr:response regulator [Myxococcales bacterium]
MSQSHAKVLVADDYGGVRDSIAAALTELGYEVRCCETGRDALAVAASAGPFDLLVASTDLPDMQGLELGRQVREQHPGLRVLFTTNGLFGRDMLAKPFTLEQLADAVTRALQGPPPRAVTTWFASLKSETDEDAS